MSESLFFSNGELLAYDSETRILEGKIVAFNTKGNTSAGATVFASGSIHIADVSKIKLVDEHNQDKPVGRMMSSRETSDGIYAKFKISQSTRGSDALLLASEGLKTGFSVGVINPKYEHKDGAIYITSADLQHVGHVERPAIATSEVTRIAASDAAVNPTESEETPMPAEAVVEVTPPAEVAPPAVEASKVEASEKVTRPQVPSVQVLGIRSPIISGGSYLEHSIKATLGNRDSIEYVHAANDSFTTNPAFAPVQYVKDITSNTFGQRPTIEACGGATALSSSGMTVSFPVITTNTTAAVTAEAASTTGTTQMASSYVSATVQKISSYNVYSLELLERSDPSFYEALLNNVKDAYAVASNAAVIAEIVSGGTQAATTAATSAGIISYVSTEVPAAFNARKKLPRVYIAGTSQWGLMMGAVDSTGRPIYNANNPMNNAGEAVPTSIRGNVLGLDLYVDPGMVATTIDDSAFIIAPGSIGIQESPTATLQTNITATGEISILYYGFLATKTLVGGGMRRFNIA